MVWKSDPWDRNLKTRARWLMHPLVLFHLLWSVTSLMTAGGAWMMPTAPTSAVGNPAQEELLQMPVGCNCTITQAGNTYPISALLNDETSVAFYSYGNPNTASANTGLELGNALILFLYQDTTTSLVSLFLIADIANDGSGGSMTFEVNCLPNEAYVSVEDDPGEFNGSPPLITGNWSWNTCCTDGGAIEDIGCNNTLNLDLLVSSGIDSIVWLTGDINAPDQILLELTGEAITINCGGGGVCCPVGFDTEILVTDATCPDTPDGEIGLSPQDGLPAYTYIWSNGGSTAHISDLLPGTYLVTVTDAQGCSEELSIVVDVSPGIPPAQSASITLCSEDLVDTFDLTSVNEVVNLGSGFTVLWFENADMTGDIINPASYVSGTATVYAVVDNGSCISEPVPVDLILLLSPMAMATTLNACEEENGMATFDLTSLDAVVSGGNGSVAWYLDAGLSNPISDPTEFYTASATIYAVVNDGSCLSTPVEIELTVDLKPIGNSAAMNLCGDEFDYAVFDLTLLENEISGGNGAVEWFLDIELTEPINDPTEFYSPSTVVYAAVFDGVCYSDPVAVILTVDHTPVGNAIAVELCDDDGTGLATFNLWDYDNQVSGGVGGVGWFYDILLLDQIPFPDAFLTDSTVVYAIVDDGICISDPVAVELNVLETPVGNPTFLETCADSVGEGIFDLTLADLVVSGGSGTVEWFEDGQGFFVIDEPTMYPSFGSIVYAQITVGECISALVPVQLMIISSVSATSVQYAVCDDGTGLGLFNLTTIEFDVSNGSGQVNWFLDALGTLVLTPPDAFVSGDSTVYASVTAGECTSDIVPVELLVLPSPVAMGVSLDLCGNAAGEILYDLTSLDTVVGGTAGDIMWYGDSMLTMLIPDPATFLTGDTIVYATVSYDNCTSAPAVITFSVSQSLTANPGMLELCIPQGDAQVIDLTESDAGIGGGVYQVNWFTDTLGTVLIMSPDSFTVSTSITVYVNVTDGMCVSEIVPVDIAVNALPEAHPFSIKKCGDISGQVTVDLTTVDSIVSSSTGIVTWYADTALTVAISDAGSFTSGDTTVYAVVTNGFCISPVVSVTLEVVDSLTATPVSIQECVIDTNIATIDLTTSEFQISGGNGTVYWFTDSLGMDTLTNPGSFTTSGDTVYALVAADGCTSDPVMITIAVSTAGFPFPLCDFTSIDSVSILWSSLTDDYELSYAINGQLIGTPWISQATTFGLGGLQQGDTLTIWVTALFDAPCMPITNSIACITDVCPSQALDFPGLASVYCSEVAFVLITASPPGGQLSGQGISGDTLYPNLVTGGGTDINYTWMDNATGCVYDLSAQVQVSDPPATPQLNCAVSTLSSVAFDWAAAAADFGYTYAINQGPASGTVLTTDLSLLIDNLNEGDSVTMVIWSVGPPPCGNSDTVSITCGTLQCPQATLTISDPGPLCAADDPIQLDVMISGLPGSPAVVWSGPGISDPSGTFDPALATTGSNTVSVTIEEGGCSYTSTIDIQVILQPDAAFEVTGIPCLDNPLQVSFTGTAFANSQFNWNLDGGELVSGSLPLDFSVQWPDPGEYTLDLVIEWNVCTSEPFSIPVQIDAPLDTPVINCVSQDYYSLVAEWDPIQDATGYTATSSLGTGVLSGTTYTVSHLPDDTEVSITVNALGASACGPTTATIACQTLPYIPPVTFVPNVFSPNGDGINDVLYVQSNGEITEVSALRIYDRWGGIVFEDLNFPTNDPAHGWDGTFKGKQLDPAVYIYFAKVQTTEDREIIIAGDVTLIR